MCFNGMSNMMYFMGPFMLLGWIAGGLIFLLAFIFWLWMLIDCLLRKMDKFDKLIWIIVIVFLQIIGALVYYLLIKRKSRR